MSRELLQCGERDRAECSTRPLVSRHTIRELPLWDDDELVALLDAYPRDDASHQALWHMKGAKRIWLYPACDARFGPAEIMEDILAGAYDYDDELPYSSEFDAHAQMFDLRSGDVVSWPQNAPQRIEKLGTVNVSLSTGFVTAAAERRSLIYCAYRLLRRRLGVRLRSTRERGPVASAAIDAGRKSASRCARGERSPQVRPAEGTVLT